MESYRIEWKHSAQKELRKLPQDAVRRITVAAEQLSKDPYPSGVGKLAGIEQAYRLRIGNYRIVYSVKSSILIVEIIRVGHRKDIYRK